MNTERDLAEESEIMDLKGILGFDYGIVQAPLGPDISGPELVAAVANAGGIGLLRCPDWVIKFASFCFCS